MAGTRQGWMIEGLPADGPLPEMKDKLMLFGQFVGDWEVYEGRYLKPDGSWAMERGEVHWRWILEGRAVQDVWMFHDDETGEMKPAGTTVRFYDPGIDGWRSMWISPRQNFVKTFVGLKVGDDIVLEGKSPEGGSLRWTFTDITPDSFTWRSRESADGGRSWKTNEEMKIRRMRK
ncbi:MAG TPA: hypothetical protein VMS77_07810 [Conexivisphaerales archaeon]|nr:hypothetical protein [Conexivisphaerales archaeon]